MRRVVTGHTESGKSVVVSDQEIPAMAIDELGSATTVVWGTEEPGRFPDDGQEPAMSSLFPPPGGALLRHGARSRLQRIPQFHPQLPRAPGRSGRAGHAPHGHPRLRHRGEGTVGMELDDGAEVLLRPGDAVVQNGTRHRWHNRGDTVARVIAVSMGAHHALEGGRPPA